MVAPQELEPLPRPSVLIVEDDAEFSQILVDDMNKVGFDTQTVEASTEAIFWFKKNPPPAMILCDGLVGRFERVWDAFCQAKGISPEDLAGKEKLAANFVVITGSGPQMKDVVAEMGVPIRVVSKAPFPKKLFGELAELVTRQRQELKAEREKPPQVLIVEDDQDLKRMFELTAKAQGYAPLVVTTTTEAREILRAHPEIELVRCDGMHGDFEEVWDAFCQAKGIKSGDQAAKVELAKRFMVVTGHHEDMLAIVTELDLPIYVMGKAKVDKDIMFPKR